jgi:serine/threonine protein kinase
LKPANIGFDEEGVLKIFDFGLAVELPEESDINSTFNLAGNTGTSRYMAIEVIRKYPYNCKADVFSYSILLWELMALCKPYDGLVGQQVKECVSLFGERPAIPRTWPTNLRRILRRGWTESLLERPHIWEVHDTLQKLLEASGKPAKLFSAK